MRITSLETHGQAPMAVPVTAGAGGLEVGAAEALFDLSLASGGARAFLYAPAANGRTFLAQVVTNAATSPVTIWMNWMAGVVKWRR